MKTIKQLLIAIILIASASNALSVESKKVMADTVRIRFENSLLEVATFNLKEHTLVQAGIQKKINEILSLLEKMESINPGKNERIYIRYNTLVEEKDHNFKTLDLKTDEINEKSLLISNDKLFEKDMGNIVLEMEDENYFIRLFLENIENAQKFTSSSFDELLKLADLEIPESRKNLNIWLEQNDTGTFNSNFLSENPYGNQDMLELSAGAGAGLVQNQFVTDFNFRIGFTFSNKGIYKNSYFVDYELLYDFSNSSENSKFDLNGFLSLGYERNFSLDPNKAKWYGFSVGYLINRGNSFFEKNTFKIAIHKQINKSIVLKPEVYFNGALKNIYPGLRVQISF